MSVRTAEGEDIDPLAIIWYAGWHEAHAHLVPAELTGLRTLESFRARLEAALPQVRVVGPSGDPAGFCLLKGNELYQLFVSAKARGSGVAAGWRLAGRTINQAETSNGAFPLEVWRYEKHLTPAL